MQVLYNAQDSSQPFLVPHHAVSIDMRTTKYIYFKVLHLSTVLFNQLLDAHFQLLRNYFQVITKL